MRRKEIGKKVLAVALTVALLGGVAAVGGQTKNVVEAAEETTASEEIATTGDKTEEATETTKKEGKVVLSVEKFTIGQGFVVEPVEVSFSGSTTVAEVFTKVMDEKNIEFVNGSTTGGLYVSTIKNADSGTINIPQAVSNMEPYSQYWISEDTYVYAPSNEVNDGNDDFPNLGEFAYNNMAGWLYTINGTSALNFDSNYTVSDGDVIRFQFSVYGYGADIGIGYGIPANLEIPAKEELIGAIAKVNSAKYLANKKVKELYDEAIEVVSSYESTEIDIIKATTALQVAADITDSEESTTEVVTTEALTTVAPTTTVQPTTVKTTTPIPTTVQPTTQAVTVGKVTIKSVKNVKGKKAKITLSKLNGAKGYQIKYSTSKKFKKAITKTTKKLTYTVKRLKKNKKYYFKARAYRIVNNKRYYGNWGKVKKVTIRK